jgi:sulfate transport system ATP-binding protein
MSNFLDNSLKVEKLRKEMRGFTLEAAFEIGCSERVGIVGRSGVGKTTLLRLLAGLDAVEKKDAGRIELAGVDLMRVPVQKREIGFVFQEQALFSGRTVFENVAFGLKVRDLEKGELKSRVEEWLEKLGLASRAREGVDHLSGGERQRVALARALVIRPKLILMDEPFNGLDPELKEKLCADIRRLHEENPVPLLFVTHDEQDIKRLSTGRLVFEESDNQSVRRVTRFNP